MCVPTVGWPLTVDNKAVVHAINPVGAERAQRLEEGWSP